MRIRNAIGRATGGGYSRLFNDDALGFLLSKAHATVIANGNELERILLSQTKNISNLDAFIAEVENNTGEIPDGVYVCTKRILKKSKLTINGIEPDLLLFLVQKHRICKVIELKDGDAFDTKKSDAEQKNLETFSKEFGSRIPFSTEYYICCFNQLDKDEIYKGFKQKFSMEHIMTGKELCELLNIDYYAIIRSRQKDAQDNREYFFDELLKCPYIIQKLAEYNKARRNS